MCLQVPVLYGSRQPEERESTLPGTGEKTYFGSAYRECTNIPTRPASIEIMLISFREGKETSMWDCRLPVSVTKTRRRSTHTDLCCL